MSGSGARRPWHRHWPADVPTSLAYPRAPAWWLLDRAAARFPDRIAIRDLDHESLDERRALTYAQLLRAAHGVASGLAQRGLAPGGRVGLCLPNGSDLVIGYHATWLAGGVAVPTNPAAAEAELRRQLDDAGVSLVIGGASGTAGAAADLGLPCLDVAAVRALESLPARAPASCRPDEDVAVLLYTGGTTGTPKGAMLTHANLVTNTIQFATWYAFAPGDEVAVAAIPMFHSGGMSGVMNVPLWAGATVLAFPRFAAGGVARAVSRYRATRLFGVPTMFIALLDDRDGRRSDYSSLRACRTNAAPLPPAVKRAFDELVGREVLVEGYGLTETSPLTHANPIGRPKAGAIGVPLPDTDARLVDPESGVDTPPGTAGELLIRGPQVMRGYWRQPEETARVLRDGWLATGDIATIDEDGYFAIVDRKKDVINTAGFKVWPREVEEALYAHPAVRLAGVIGVADDYRGEIVKAYVVLKDGTVATPEELIAFCRARLTAYKAPRIVELAADLPVTATGKLLRRALRDRHEADLSTRQTSEAPRGR